MKNFLLFLFISLGVFVNAQNNISIFNNGFVRDNIIEVFDIENNKITNPFVGGINSAQYNSIDINLDGKLDLLIFDRIGNRLLPYLYLDNNYKFSPEYINRFPKIQNWIRCKDYDNDGKVDIFTYTIGGIKVYRNDSDAELKFTQVTNPYIISQFGSVATNILVTSVDYPAIVDIDDDNDLDILTFWGLGSFIEFHKNMSQEYYGNSDSLVFVKADNCWGQFAEGSEDNTLVLDTCIDFKNKELLKFDDPKHTGSTLLINDFNGDGKKDLILGDVDYPDLIFLENGGDNVNAQMIEYSSFSPDMQNQIFINSFPAAELIDVNNDSILDLICTTFSPSMVKDENRESNWLFINSGSNNNPNYILETKSFMQEDMLDFGSGAYPLFTDIDSDGLVDIIVGNWGYYDSSQYSNGMLTNSFFHSQVTFIKNIGNKSEPKYKIIDTNFLKTDTLKTLSLIPSSADIDNDSDIDLVFGNKEGTLFYAENNLNQTGSLSFKPIIANWKNIDVGEYSAPCLYDIDNDGLIDLICGDKMGKLSFYKNIGNKNNPEFLLVSSNFGGVNVTDQMLSYNGYSVPSFVRNKSDELLLFCGSESGKIWVYNNIENNISGDFNCMGYLDKIYEGIRIGVSFKDINNDSIPDLLVGNYSGGFTMYIATSENPFKIEKENKIENSFYIYPNPAQNFIKIETSKLLQNKSYSIIITDATGKLLITKKNFYGNNIIDISNLKSGVYTVLLFANKNIFSKNFIKN